MKKYWLNVSLDYDGGDNIVASYTNRKEFLKNFLQDAKDYLRENDVDPDGDGYMMYYQIEDKDDMYDVSLDSIIEAELLSVKRKFNRQKKLMEAA